MIKNILKKGLAGEGFANTIIFYLTFILAMEIPAVLSILFIRMPLCLPVLTVSVIVCAVIYVYLIYNWK